MLVFNHFEFIRGICTKTGLIRSLDTYYKNNFDFRLHNYTVFDTTPTTFLVKIAIPEMGLNPLRNRFKEL